MIKIHRRKPVEVEALQYTGDNEKEFKDFGLVLHQPFSDNDSVRAIFPHGVMGGAYLLINKGDYLVRDDESYKVYNEKEFKNKYEEV